MSGIPPGANLRDIQRFLWLIVLSAALVALAFIGAMSTLMLHALGVV